MALAVMLSAPAAAAADVPPGFDLFETDPQNTTAHFEPPYTAIPPGFFDDTPGHTSDPFMGEVNFGGIPVNEFMGHDTGDTDTIVSRTMAAMLGPTFPDDASVPIELVQLNLVSMAPIMVTYNGGQNPEPWQVNVSPSPSEPSRGDAQIIQQNAKGGTMNSEFRVIPLLTFTRISDRAQRTIDVAEYPPQVKNGFTLFGEGMVWRAGCVLPALAVQGLNDGFCPGLNPQTGQKQLTVEEAALARHGVYPAQPALEHFKCYTVKRAPFKAKKVRLSDQFGQRAAKVKRRAELCNPVRKNKEPFRNRAAHLQCYKTRGPAVNRPVDVQNQFGAQRLLVGSPRRLCLPTKKRIAGEQGETVKVPIDHFQCYGIEPQSPIYTPNPVQAVNLKDQFHREKQVRIGKPKLLCAPVVKNNERPIQHPVRHLVCYAIEDKDVVVDVEISNQFERQKLTTQRPALLCVPSNKYAYPNP